MGNILTGDPLTTKFSPASPIVMADVPIQIVRSYAVGEKIRENANGVIFAEYEIDKTQKLPARLITPKSLGSLATPLP